MGQLCQERFLFCLSYNDWLHNIHRRQKLQSVMLFSCYTGLHVSRLVCYKNFYGPDVGVLLVNGISYHKILCANVHVFVNANVLKVLFGSKWDLNKDRN